jgi:hypothetical protein
MSSFPNNNKIVNLGSGDWIRTSDLVVTLNPLFS